MTVPETVMHDSRNQTGRNISASDETKSDVSEEAPDIKITAFYGKRMKKIAGACLIAAAVLFVIMLFSSDIDRILTDRIPYTYSLGCSLINYSAGFIRRGLFGELIGLMNGVLQPVLSIMLISALSLIFILS